MLNIKRYFPNLKFNIASSFYLVGAIIVIMKFPSLIQNRLFLILSLLSSVTFLICAYQNKKRTLNKIIENSIVKWVSTDINISCLLMVCKAQT